MGMDSFCYAISDYQNRISFACRMSGTQTWEPPFFESLPREHPYLFFPFLKTGIALAMPQQALVPDRLFIGQEAKHYLHHGNILRADAQTVVDELPEIRAKRVYAVPKPLLDWAHHFFPTAKIAHLHSALLPLFRMRTQGTGKFLYGHIWEEGMSVFLFEHQNLVLENRFECHASADFLYYLLLVCQQLKAPTRDISLFVSGAITEDSELFRLLQGYFLRVGFLPLGEVGQFGPQAARYPVHYFNDLLAIGRLAEN
jgi:hypothetical protein